jgi:hypothetical protein
MMVRSYILWNGQTYIKRIRRINLLISIIGDAINSVLKLILLK